MQAQEEREHGMKVYTYLNDKGKQALFADVKAPKAYPQQKFLVRQLVLLTLNHRSPIKPIPPANATAIPANTTLMARKMTR